MTKEEAIYWLRRYRRTQTYTPDRKLYGWNGTYDFTRAGYERFLIENLIYWIRDSKLPPIEVVRKVYWDLDNILVTSENSKTWAFASTMENCASDILRYLKAKEKVYEEH